MLPIGYLDISPTISIHAPHEGERLKIKTELFNRREFQSTLPTRGSDYAAANALSVAPGISIHAPHEGERQISHIGLHLLTHFNPRSPRGGATKQDCPDVNFTWISIHAPHEGERPYINIFLHGE